MDKQDPLAQLKDIQLPDPVSFWPLAPGWWFLTAVIIGIITFAIWKLIQQQRRQQYRQTASQLLTQAKIVLTNDNDVKTYLQTLAAILRRTALTAYSDQSVEPLQGDAWLKFLDSKIQKKMGNKVNLSFITGPAKKIISLPYQDLTHQNIDPDELTAIHDAIVFWVNNHTTEIANKQKMSELHYA